ncbi:hypothetical protein B7P43_G12670 [Cryptotermes secundus]|uniref:DUF4817 domain-containing protein n=1 Tax=Cryptotermes secundus TaxID=105785 RepID=A0A2J7QRR4_9NEOP|nr:hypothetical protein B7P43_G12670 [Cryptotermes secundus]
MGRYTLEQHVFLYDTYVKYRSARMCHRFHDETAPSRQTIHNLVNKFRTGLLIYKKQKHECQVLGEEKLDETGARLKHILRKSLKRVAQGTRVSKSSARTATQLLKPSSESWCLVYCKCKDRYTCVLQQNN